MTNNMNNKRFNYIVFTILINIFSFNISFAQSKKVHILKKGENLSVVAKKYKVSLSELKKANPNLGDKLDIGDKINLPASAKSTEKPKPKPATAKGKNKKPEAPVENEEVAVEESPVNDSGDFIKHKIKSGEKLSLLCKKYNVTPKEIKDANPTIGKEIKVGTVINIPKKEQVTTVVSVEEEPKAETETTQNTNPNQTIHVVKSKETLYTIAKKYKTTVAKIQKLNPELGMSVKIGQSIIVADKSANSKPNVSEQSNNQEETKGNGIHIVKSKETLSSIAKKYKVTLVALKKANPKAAKGLKLGQELIIPGLNNSQETVSEEVEEKPTKPQAEPVTEDISVEKGYHLVKPRQTLYSIAKQYKVSVTQLTKWNNLKGSIDVNQKLIVSKAKFDEINAENVSNTPTETIASSEVKQEEKVSPIVPAETLNTRKSAYTEPDEPIKQETSRAVVVVKEPEPVVDPSTIKVTTSTAVNASGYNKITESGLGEIMGENVETTKFLALHKTAPIGTLIQVKNPMNGVAIFVRVIGKLPDTPTNDKIVIKVTKKVRERIGALNSRFPVEISYIP